jgi:murein DD-endopeptidase MepM/ murein hydrolase activator NlpD
MTHFSGQSKEQHQAAGKQHSRLIEALKKAQGRFQPVMKFDFRKEPLAILDFSAGNPRLAQVDLADTAAFCKFVEQELALKGATIGAGGYGENRLIYGSPVFEGGPEPRTIHLGIDIWTKAGTAVFAPLDGRVHSFQNNAAYRDYGPTIILEHVLLDGERFHTLYGHLSLDSLDGITVGAPIQAGQEIARLGSPEVNVSWPPHLHFQLIRDLEGRSGDFPGVAAPSEKAHYLALCPDPNLILQLPGLS